MMQKPRAKHANCSVVGCCSQYGSLHILPQAEHLRTRWIRFIFDGNVPSKPAKGLYVCANHFTSDCFVNEGQFNAGYASKLKLRDGSVPTIRDPASDVKPASTSLQPPSWRDAACQTDPTQTRTVGTQLSLRTLQPHIRSAGVQTNVSCRDFDVGTSTAATLPFLFSTPMKRPRQDLQEEEDEDPFEGSSSQELDAAYDIADTVTALTESIDMFGEASGVTNKIKKYIVYENCIMELFEFCPMCQRTCDVETRRQGTFFSVEQLCPHCQYFRNWKSQPVLGKTPAGNLQLSAAVYASGASFLKLEKIFKAMQLQLFQQDTFRRHAKMFVEAALVKKWKTSQDVMLQEFGDEEKVIVGDDMQADSPEQVGQQMVSFGTQAPNNPHSKSVATQHSTVKQHVRGKGDKFGSNTQMHEDIKSTIDHHHVQTASTDNHSIEVSVKSEESDPMEDSCSSQLCTDCGMLFLREGPHACEHKTEPSSGADPGSTGVAEIVAVLDEESDAIEEWSDHGDITDEESDPMEESEESLDEDDVDSDEEWRPVEGELLLDNEESDEQSEDECSLPLDPKSGQLCTDCGKFFNKLRPHTCEHKIKPFACNICGKRCVTEAALNSHKVVHDENYEHRCKYCHDKFKTKMYKITHEQTHLTEEKPYKCPDCSERFATNKKRRIHLQSHRGSPQFKCDICGIEFCLASYLKRHMTIHTGVKSFKCSVCQRGFNQASHLKSHMRLHTGERPYKCEHCDKCFNHNVSLKSHVQRYHTSNSGQSETGDAQGNGNNSEEDTEEEVLKKRIRVSKRKRRSTGRPVGRPKRNTAGNLVLSGGKKGQCSKTMVQKKDTTSSGEGEDKQSDSNVSFDPAETVEKATIRKSTRTCTAGPKSS